MNTINDKTARKGRACPLCLSPKTVLLFRENARDYVECRDCGMLFVPREFHLTRKEEKARYLRHRNDPAEPGYGDFLSRLIDPLAAKLSPGARGLDFGSGPSSAVSALMSERGFRVTGFDPYFLPDGPALERAYEFIVCAEAAEHFREPKREFQQLNSLLEPGGWLGVMTQMCDSVDSLRGWWYLRDRTHVSMYRKKTMLWIAERFGWEASFPEKGVVLFRKREDGHG